MKKELKKLEESLTQISKFQTNEPDSEGEMAKSQMLKTMKYAVEIMNMIDDTTELPAWVQSKLTKISDYIGAVKHYMDSKTVRHVVTNMMESDTMKLKKLISKQINERVSFDDLVSKKYGSAHGNAQHFSNIDGKEYTWNYVEVRNGKYSVSNKPTDTIAVSKMAGKKLKVAKIMKEGLDPKKGVRYYDFGSREYITIPVSTWNNTRAGHYMTPIKESVNESVNESIKYKDVKKGDVLYTWIYGSKKGGKQEREYYKVKILEPISDEPGHERFRAKQLDGLNKGKTVVVWLDTLSKKANESVNEAVKPSQVRSTISKVKKQLMRKWKQKGGYENFGQKELSQMRDKFDYNPYGSSDERQIAKMLDGFNDWAMNYDGNMSESINEADVVGKTVFSDDKGKLFFGYYKDDDGVTLVDYKTWAKLSMKDVSKDDTNKDRVIKAILRKQKQFNKKVEYNMWQKKNKPSFEEKMEYFMKNGFINNITKRGIKVYEGVESTVTEAEKPKVVTKAEWDKTHKDFKGMVNGKPYMMWLDKKTQKTVYGPVTIKESNNFNRLKELANLK